MPIIPVILWEHWSTKATDADTIMLWGTAVLYIFGFFRSGEWTVPTLNAYDLKKILEQGGCGNR